MIRTRALAAALFAAFPIVALSATTVPPMFDKPAASEGAVFDTFRYRARVKVDTAKLFALKPGSRLALTLPGLNTYPIEFDQIVARDGGLREWQGHVVGERDLNVVLTDADGTITGVVPTPDKTYKLKHENGANWLVWEYGVSTPTSTRPAQPGSGAALAFSSATLMTASTQPVPAVDADAMNLPAFGSYPATIDIAGLSNLPENGETIIALPNAGNFNVVYERTETSDSGAATWVGYLRDYGPNYRMMVTYNPDSVEGRVLAPAGEYLIHTVGQNQYIVDVRRAGMVPTPFTESDTVKPTGKAARITASDLSTTATSTGTASTVDLLVLYTPGFVKVNGTAATAQTRIDQLVALANQAYKDSGVNMKLRVIQRQQVGYADNTTNGAALDALGYGRDAFSTIFALRDKIGADMVTLLRPFNYAAQKSCGTSYLGGPNGKPMADYSDYAFSVVSDGRDAVSGYYCTDYGLAHELGHNMGNMHDRSAELASGTTITGAYPYSYGYGIEGRFGTIMSYMGPRIGKFSNPLDHTCDGNLACGISEKDTSHSANDALSLNNVRGAIAAFRPTRIAHKYGISGTVTYNRKGLQNVVISGAGATCTKTSSSGAYSCTVPGGWSNTLKASRSGYTFSPGSITISNLQGGLSGRNFTARKK